MRLRTLSCAHVLPQIVALLPSQEKLKRQSSLQEVPASAVLQAIETEKPRRMEDKAKEAEDNIRLDEVNRLSCLAN